MLKRILSFLSVAFILIPVNSQTIGIGESIGDFRSSEVLNWSENTFQFKELNGKAVILVFWSPGCISCIKEFSKLDSLQDQFKESLQFVLSAQPGKDSIKRFFAQRKRIKQPNIPIICSDSLLRKLMPYQGNPFHVWINKQGIVEYFDGSQYTKAEYISKFLSGEKINIKSKMSVAYIPFISDQWRDFAEFYSFISRYTEYTTPEVERNPGFTGIISQGFPIIKLYQQAINGLTRNKYQLYRPGRIIMETNDFSRYIYPSRLEERSSWEQNNLFNYELYLPVSKKEKMYEIMKRDLDLYFGLETSIEKRFVKCLVLKRTSSQDKMRSKGELTKDTFTPSSIKSSTFDSIRLIQNLPYSVFSLRLQTLAESTLNAPFIDLTGYSGNVDIQVRGISLDPFNLSAIKEDLKKYDLNIDKEYLSLDVLIIKDNANKKN